MNPENLLPAHGEVFYYPAFFSGEESDAYLHALQESVSWKQEPIKIMGKEIMQPRLTAWYGEKPYRYSGITMDAQPWIEPLLSIKTAVETFLNTEFTGVLLNRYRTGADSMGWHRDNEKMLGPNPLVASVSFGDARVFQFRDYPGKTIRRSLALAHGSLLIMQGETQHCWEHQLPKTSRPTHERLNLTFRKMF